jgi:hypothetical protein
MVDLRKSYVDTEDVAMEFHADYSHHPGTLHGCQACEENCYCDKGEMPCLLCSSEVFYF